MDLQEPRTESPQEIMIIQPQPTKKLKLRCFVVFALTIASLIPLMIFADKSQIHLDKFHANWNGRPVVTLVKDFKGDTEDLAVYFEEKQEGASSINIASAYDESIRDINALIQRIDSSFNQFQCLPIDPLFDFYGPGGMYFSTYDQVLIPACDNLYDFKWSGDRENIAIWNRKRTVTQWAFHALEPNENVLYYRPGVYNHAELILVSKLVAPNGRIFVLGYEKGRKCFESTQRVNEAPKNVQFITAKELSNINELNALIAHESIFKDGPLSVLPVLAFTKMLLFCNDGKQTASSFTNFRVEKVLLRNELCGKGVFMEDNGKGFFSFTSTGVPLYRRVLSKLRHSFFVFAEYDKFKLTQKKNISAELAKLQRYADLGICQTAEQRGTSVTTVYGHKLIGVSLKQMQGWETQRQAVEWAREEKKQDIYYEMAGINLLVIIELSFLIEHHTLFVVCAEHCARIASQLRPNICLLAASDTAIALKVGAIITDNYELVRDSVAKGFLQRGALLTYIVGDNGLVLLRQLFVAHRLREIVLPNKQGHCLGFTYLHSFWDSLQPNGFYDVTPSKMGYVAYAFWGGNPRKVSQRKKFLIEELMSTQVQFKLVNADEFLYFETEESPIHSAFFYLSPVHKSDYFRMYVMHNYGGAYVDVKHQHANLSLYLDKLYKSDKLMAIGVQDDGTCYEQQGRMPCWMLFTLPYRITSSHNFFYKKKTKLTIYWREIVHQYLDGVYDELKRNLPKTIRQMRGAHHSRVDGTRFISRYPIEWSIIAGGQINRAQFKYMDNVENSFPPGIYMDYRIAEPDDIY